MDSAKIPEGILVKETTVHVKFRLAENSCRRARLEIPLRMSEVTRKLSTYFPELKPGQFSIQYQDEEGERIEVVNDADLAEAVAVFGAIGRVVAFSIIPTSVEVGASVLPTSAEVGESDKSSESDVSSRTEVLLAKQEAVITGLNTELAKVRDEFGRQRSEVDELVKKQAAVLADKDEQIASAEKKCQEAQRLLNETNTTLQLLVREKLVPTKADASIAEAKQESPLSAWQSIGSLHSFVFEEMVRKYPFTHYQWGATYNTFTIRPVAINGWNRGVRVLCDGAYLQGDNGASLYMGSALMTRGTDDAGTQATKKADGTAEFLQHYVTSTGKKTGGSNKNSFGMYVRKLAHPWEKVGRFVTRTDFLKCKEKYPHHDWEWGTNYNMYEIKPLTVTSWNRGHRIHVTTPYIQNDSVDTMRLGTPVWTLGTDDPESKNTGDKFYHRYYQCQKDDHKYTSYSSNGHNGFTLFVRRF